MITKLPAWAPAGSAALALIAGMINAVGFLSFQHQGVTHLTGSTTLLGIALAKGDQAGTWHLLAIAASFVAGCVVSGALLQDSTLRLGRRYGVALVVESALLLCAIPLLTDLNMLGAYLTSAACGLQNGMASNYTGAVLRTTHVSGAFTDIGIFLGQRLRSVPGDARRAKLCLMITSAFLFGSVIGAVGYFRWSYTILYVPALAVGAVGLVYGASRQFTQSVR